MTEARSRYRVTGMDCASCATKIDTAVRRLPGIDDVAVSVSAGTMTVKPAAGADLAEAIERSVTRLGYGIAPLGDGGQPAQPAAHDHGAGHDHAHHDHDHDHDGHSAPPAALGLHGHDHAALDGPWWQNGKARLTLAAGLGLVVAFLVGQAEPAIAPYAYVAAMAIGLVPIARRAAMAALYGTPFSIETLMTIAAIGAVAIGAAEEAAAVVFLFLVGELLEGVAAGRARASISGLAKLVPDVARLDRDGTIVEVPASSLTVGSFIEARPGDRIAADGIIAEGASAIDEALVTGESVPKRKGVGAPVFAGTINGDGLIRIRVTAAASDNTIARIVRLVEEAQEAKAPTERFIDRFSRWYTPAVLVVGALVAILPPLVAGAPWDSWIYKGLAILLIGCPCALVISTPAAIAAGLAWGARNGLLIKGGAILEQLGRITTVTFDKTGTLTEGRPTVTDIVGIERPEAEVLALAAALEAGSSHPLARAILDRAAAAGGPSVTASDLGARGGRGVFGRVGDMRLFLGSLKAAASEAAVDADVAARAGAFNDEGKTVSVLVVDGRVAGLIAMRDEPRPDAAAGIAALKRLGIDSLMLTGDTKRTAEAIAASIGMTVRAELLPADKQRIVKELQGEGRIVAKVGDGINDAPALAAADIGIAMGGGTDVALETGDAAILHSRVGDVAGMVKLSRRTMRNIGQNITIALGLKAVFLVTTILGVTGLWPAILADTGATVLVTINALTLLWRRREPVAAS